jgi:hypothetical protein
MLNCDETVSDLIPSLTCPGQLILNICVKMPLNATHRLCILLTQTLYSADIDCKVRFQFLLQKILSIYADSLGPAGVCRQRGLLSSSIAFHFLGKLHVCIFYELVI